MIAILELTSRAGYEVVINFATSDDSANEEQVNRIASNFTDIREAILSLFRDMNQPTVMYYKCTPKRNYLQMIRVGQGRWDR